MCQLPLLGAVCIDIIISIKERSCEKIIGHLLNGLRYNPHFFTVALLCFDKFSEGGSQKELK